jgi:hypothetical protein
VEQVSIQLSTISSSEQAQDVNKCAWLCSFSAILDVAILIIKLEFGVFEL